MRRGRALGWVGAAGLVLALAGPLDALGPTLTEGVSVASAVGFGLVAHGGVPEVAEISRARARGGDGYRLGRPYLPLLVSGLWLAWVFGARAVRSRSWRELGFHLALGFASGVVASRLTRGGLDGSLFAGGLVVAVLLASVPWLMPVDWSRTLALHRLAARARGPARVRLLRALVAQRQLGILELSAPARRRLERTLDAVIRGVAARPNTGPGAVEREGIEQLVRAARRARAIEHPIGPG